ncbi:hypothetical protein RhiirA5_357547 [Rhizophagus irregularis]|uniref:Uncharacterized protein n=1 Tax=Rhizophagus irregularis TaxID=588596 RepID=A0A2N0RKR5_9GLOM|nr:hypothetical protein RhiirA5_357547 [Rhizophagus irregularis]PKC63875.1 hypothetical protein RhiirA1_422228 [Rhizophagus irregularis]
MYGIVSTGVDWVIIKLVTTTGEYNDSDNGNVEVLLSSVFDKVLLEKLKNLFGQINGCLVARLNRRNH